MNLTTEKIGFVLSAIFVLLLVAKMIWRKIRSRGESEASRRDDLERESIGSLKSIAVTSLPMIEFSRATFSSTEVPQCSICLEEYKERDIMQILPVCGHNFHHACIQIWLKKQSTCPNCRLSLRDSSKDSKSMVSPVVSLPV